MYISEANKAKILGAIAMRERNKAAAQVTVLLSQQAGTHKARILTRKDAIKLAAEQRRIGKVRDQHKIGACVFGAFIAKVLYQ